MMAKPNTTFSPYDTSEYLDNPELLVACLNVAATDNDPVLFSYALEKTVKA